MRKGLVLVALVLLTGTIVLAQEVPVAEAYGGFTWVRFNPASNVNAFTAVGGIGSFQVNIHKNVGIVGEFGGTTHGDITVFGASFPMDQTQFSYLFGPRLFVNKAGRFSPFVEFLIGGNHDSRSFSVPNSAIPVGAQVPSGVTAEVGATSTKFRTTQNAFSYAIGGGFDIKLSKAFAVRPIQLDYMPTHFSPFNIPGIPGTVNDVNWQHNIRYSAGVLFRFGSRS